MRPEAVKEHASIFNKLKYSEYIIENLADVIWILDYETLTFNYISPGIKQLRGLSVNECLKQSLEESLAPNSFDKFKEIIGNTIENYLLNRSTQEILINDIEFICSNGKTVLTELNCKLLINNYGKIEIHGSCRDISSRKRLESSLKASLKTNNQIVSILSHDLRGPLGNLNELIALVIENFDTYDNTILKQLLHSISVTTNNTFQLMDNLVEWAKIHRNDGGYEFNETNLYNVAKEEIDIYSSMIKNKGINVCNNLPKDLLANCNKESVAIVVRNLLSNALKFTGIGGSIIIEAKQDNKRIEISICDSGVGIPEHIQSKLLQTTKKISKPGTNNESGTGLGLMLSKELIERNNGNLWFKSKEGEGTRFSFSLNKN